VSQGGTYSQYDEDRWIADLIAEMPGIPRTFVEIGCGDGSENNTRLLLDRGWEGCWYDASPENIKAAVKVNPWSECQRVTCEDFPRLSFSEGIGLLSIDVDGNDWHLWKRSHELGWRPWVVVIEAQIQKPFDEPYVMPYNPDWVWPDDPATETYDWGASVYSLIELGKAIGYTYVGKPENPHCPNLFFVRSDLA
jgi:hypothetical protein